VTEREAAAAHLRRQSSAGWETVSPFSTTALAALRGEAETLPSRYDVFARALLGAREPVASDVKRLARALQRAGSPEHPGVQGPLRRADTPMARAAVAKGLAVLREHGDVDEYVVAAGLFELADYRSPLTEAALVAAALEVAAGAAVRSRARLAGARAGGQGISASPGALLTD
jgi:hypothetical protein